MKKIGFIGNLKYDIPAGVVVFLVAVPLCLGIALASGAPLFAGIIAGIVGGVIVGSISGSPLGVSGPAAGLVAIVLSAIATLGSWEAFLLAVVLSGVLQIALGFARAGIIGYYFPSSVIKGMLSAIGLIIILKQIPHAFGYDKDYEGDLAFAQADGQNTFSELFNMLNYVSPGAIIITLVSLGILILWEQQFMKKIRVFQIIQGPLVAVTAGIIMGLAFLGSDFFALNPEKFVSLPVASSISDFFGQFTFPDFSQITNPVVYTTAITLALVASLETLLCVEATDKLDPYKRITPTNRELFAQGAGNMISGLIGGLPVTQVIVRSSANIQSGGRTKFSAIFHGGLLIVTVAFIPNILNMIPYASLAAILLMVGYKLAKPAIFKAQFGLGTFQFAPFIATIVAVLFTDLLIGIGIGLAVAVMFILYNNFRMPYRLETEELQSGDVIRIELSEDVSFLNKAGILKSLDEIPDGSKVTIDATKTVNIDYDVLEIIRDFVEKAKINDIDLTIEGLDESRSENHVKLFHKMVKNAA